MRMNVRVNVLIISGSMGAGKTTVLGEVSDILTMSGIPHAAVDLDALGMASLPAGAPDDLMFRNLAAVWKNYASAGLTRLLIARAVESAAELEQIRAAVPGSRLSCVACDPRWIRCDSACGCVSPGCISAGKSPESQSSTRSSIPPL